MINMLEPYLAVETIASNVGSIEDMCQGFRTDFEKRNRDALMYTAHA